MVVLISTENIPKEEAKRYLVLSIVLIILPPFLSLLGLYYPFAYGAGIFLLFTSLTFMVVGIVSLIFYFVNHEIMYGMLIGRKKSKEINNQNVLMGRRVLAVILICGICANIFIFLIIIGVLF